MVLLNPVVQVFTLPNIARSLISFVGVEREQSRCVGPTFIDSDHLRLTLMANGLAKEAQCGCSIPFGGQQEVDGVTQYPPRGTDISTGL